MSLKRFFVFNKCVFATIVMLATVMATFAQQSDEQAIKDFETKHPNGIVVTSTPATSSAARPCLSRRASTASRALWLYRQQAWSLK